MGDDSHGSVTEMFLKVYNIGITLKSHEICCSWIICIGNRMLSSAIWG